MPVSWPSRSDWIRCGTRGGLIAFVVGLMIDQGAQADQIRLRGGGQIHGKLVADPTDPNRWTLITPVGKTPIHYAKEQVIQVVAEKSGLDEYVDLLKRDRPVAEEEYQLGAWCEEHGYQDLAENHYAAATRLDPRYAPAHEKLGHVFNGDRWLNAAEQREAQGLISYRGHWITTEEKERIDEQAALEVENQSWNRRIKILSGAFLAGPASRTREAEERLLAIREAAAVGAVYRILGSDDNFTVRKLASRVLGSIPGPEAASALVTRLLAESDAEVRPSLIAELNQRETEAVVPALIRALRATDPLVVNRAAWGLGQLNARTAVPKLIAALVTTEYQTRMVPVTRGGGGGANFGASFNSVAPGGVGFGNYTGSTYLGITPPAVAPGVVAFGYTEVPIGSGVGLGNNNGGGGGGVQLVPRVVPVDHPNVEVRAALTRMTNQDFGYDLASWRRWASSSFRSDPTPDRRVLQP